MNLPEKNKNYIGFYGYPSPDIIEKYKKMFQLEFLDLDVDYGQKETDTVPDAYCQIITNIVDNAIAFRNQLKVIIASVGEEKCDQGRFAGYILHDLGFNVIFCRFNNYDGINNPLKYSVSDLPLREKILTIMDSLVLDLSPVFSSCEPTHGFWGVPPHDLDILDLFPDTTHVFGWTRCVEAGRPADLDLEMVVNPDIPTVFYAQTFCAKNQLAKYLAEKHRGLYVDCDGLSTASIRAKIEAFIRLG